MVVARLRRNAKIGTKESRADLGDEFFHRVTCIGKPLAAKVTIQAALVASPVRHFMGKGGVVAFAITKRLQFRHLHDVAE